MNLNWSNFTNEIDKVKELSPDEKKEFKNAIEYIRQEIFEAKPDDSLEDIHHLITSNMKMLLPWSNSWTIDFYQAVSTFAKQVRDDKLFKEIKDPLKFRNILFEISVGEAFIRNGFELEHHPPIERNGQTKNPDFRIMDPTTKSEYYIEASVIKDSKESRDRSYYLGKMTKGISNMKGFDPGLIHYGKFHVDPSNESIDELLKKVNKTLEVGSKKGFGQFKDPRFSFACSTSDKKYLLNKWAGKGKGNISCSSCIIIPNPNDKLYQIKKTLKDEEKQLKKDKSNILFLQSDILMSKYDKKRLVKTYVTQIQQFLHKYHNILFCIVTFCVIQRPTINSKLEDIPYSRLSYDSEGDIQRYTLILENEHFKGAHNTAIDEEIVRTCLLLRKIYI